MKPISLEARKKLLGRSIVEIDHDLDRMQIYIDRTRQELERLTLTAYEWQVKRSELVRELQTLIGVGGVAPPLLDAAETWRCA